MRRSSIACGCLLLLASVAHAQLLSDFEIASENFYYRIKNIEFFMDRFNHSDEGRVPNINKNDTTSYLKWLKERNTLLFTLFDKQKIRREGDQYVTHKNYADFIRQVNDPYHQQYLHFADSNWFATLKFAADYQGKPATIDCTLKVNKSSAGVYTWILSSATSQDLGIDESFKTHIPFTPLVHGTDFMGVRLALSDPQWIKKLRETGDLPSRFLDMLTSKELRLQQISNITYHLLQLDNWIVVVNYTTRQDANSGWLVSELVPADAITKNGYRVRLHLR